MKYNSFFSSLGNAALRLLFILLVLVLIGVGVAGTYIWRQRKIDNLNQQISSLQAQLQTAKQGSSSNQTTPSPTPSSSQPQTPSTSYTSEKGVKVVVYFPVKDATVSSPLGVIGEVPGSWSFEASFPILLEDSSGGVVAQGTAQVLSDWMTNQLVPFSAKLTFTGTPTGNGKLVLQKDNPSGLAQNADTVSIPVKL